MLNPFPKAAEGLLLHLGWSSPTIPGSLQLPPIVKINSITDALKLCSQKPHSVDSFTDHDIRLLPDAGLEPLQHPRWRSPLHQSTASSKRLTQRTPTYITQHEADARRCSVKKVFFEISQNSQENTCAQSFLFRLTAPP